MAEILCINTNPGKTDFVARESSRSSSAFRPMSAAIVKHWWFFLFLGRSQTDRLANADDAGHAVLAVLKLCCLFLPLHLAIAMLWLNSKPKKKSIQICNFCRSVLMTWREGDAEMRSDGLPLNRPMMATPLQTERPSEFAELCEQCTPTGRGWWMTESRCRSARADIRFSRPVPLPWGLDPFARVSEWRQTWRYHPAGPITTGITCRSWCHDWFYQWENEIKRWRCLTSLRSSNTTSSFIYASVISCCLFRHRRWRHSLLLLASTEFITRIHELKQFCSFVTTTRACQTSCDQSGSNFSSSIWASWLNRKAKSVETPTDADAVTEKALRHFKVSCHCRFPKTETSRVIT